ncbi:MAG TPA: HDOD domain-containing protein [Chthoniobacterales bacterium]|jgi:HD-like signal output (HDOD) protein|nr:HDOD domain-containing protein [Chthoniobacterales bacterium]
MTPQIDLERLIEQARELAPFRATTVRLAQMVASPDCDISEVADLVAYDQAMTVKLLQIANSAAFANLSPIATAQAAVARLGTAQVLALAAAMGARFHLQIKLPGYNLNEGALWHHSVAAAVAAEVAPRFCTRKIPAEAVTAALLHDVGKVIMGRFLDAEMLRLIAEAKQADRLTQLEAERRVLGMHHGELGGLMIQHWQLPAGIVSGTIHHHDPAEGRNVICDFTYLANEAAKRVEAELEGCWRPLTIMPDVAERLGMDPSRLEEYRAAVTARFTAVSSRYYVL